MKNLILSYLSSKGISPSKQFIIFLDIYVAQLYNDNISLTNINDAKFESIEDLAYQLDSLFSDSERKTNGIYFTPKSIAKLMTKYTLNLETSDTPPYVLDPAVGSGVFLLSMARALSKKFSLSIRKTIEEHLFGIDIIKDNVIIPKILLATLSFEEEGVVPEVFNITQYNSLSVNKESLQSLFSRENFDIVISNPPYVSGELIPAKTRQHLKHYPNTVYGNPDLYIPFFELAINSLKPSGIGAFITPNSYFRSLNGKKLRSFLRVQTETIKLINFNSELIFDGVLHYSAINFFTKKSNVKQENQMFFLDNFYNDIDIKDFHWTMMDPIDSWYTLNDIEKSIISKLEKLSDTTLNDLKFQNGVATQRNNIFMFKYTHEDEEYYYFEKKSEKYKIEKKVTRPFVLPNKSNKDEKLRIIFPYQYLKDKDTIVPISPNDMSKNYQFCLKYLNVYKHELEKRKFDKNMKYWYLFGRSQGLKQYGPRLYIPYMANTVKTSLSTRNDEVFAAGYAIFSDSTSLLQIISQILESKLFSFYISRISKPYTGGYFSTAKNMIKDFSLPTLSTLENLNPSDIDDKSLYQLYNLSSDEISFIEEIF